MYHGKTGEYIGETGSPAHKGGIYDVSEFLYNYVLCKVPC